MNVEEVPPQVDRDALLAGGQFADAYRVTVEDGGLDARRAADKLFARGPRWLEALFVLRAIIVAPFGLKPSGIGEPSVGGIIGIFPVLGFDHHLDFRIVVDVTPSGRGRRVTTTTLVRTYNALVRIYLAAVLPFHRLIARVMLRRVFYQPT